MIKENNNKYKSGCYTTRQVIQFCRHSIVDNDSVLIRSISVRVMIELLGWTGQLNEERRMIYNSGSNATYLNKIGPP